MLYEFDPCILSLIVEQYEKTLQEEKKPSLLEETTHGFNPYSLPQREKNGQKFWKISQMGISETSGILGFQRAQINAELNTSLGWVPLLAGTGGREQPGGCSQAGSLSFA